MDDLRITSQTELIDVLRGGGYEAWARGDLVQIVGQHAGEAQRALAVRIEWRADHGIALFAVTTPLSFPASKRGDVALTVCGLNRKIGLRGFLLLDDGIAFETHAFLEADKTLSRHVVLMSVGNALAAVKKFFPELEEVTGDVTAKRTSTSPAGAFHVDPPADALAARSQEEAQTFMSLHPCVCGDEKAPPVVTIDRDDQRRIVTWRGACGTCGRERRFAFILPLKGKLPPGGAYGGPEPSALIDPGEWLASSDQ